MKLLLDTHIVLWAVGEQRKLSAAEHRLLDDPRHDFAVSAVSLWEIRLKWSEYGRSGRRRLLVSPLDARSSAIMFGWSLIDLTPDHAVATLDHPLPHRDPFDELLLTQAQVEGMRLLTRDTLLERHPLALFA